MQHANKAVISPKLKGLMLIQQGLEAMKNAEPSEQGPAGPTVAGLAEDAGRKALGEQDPSAIASPDSGIAGIAQNAATGNAIMMAQQQQQQQQGPPVAAPPQMPPPPGMASGGIATLRADNMRGFKEGGVLGFAGPTGSGPILSEGFAEGDYDQDSPNRTAFTLGPTEKQQAQRAEALAMVAAMQKKSAIDKVEAERAKNMAAAQFGDRPERDAARIQEFAEASAPPAAPVARPPAAPVARPPVAAQPTAPAQPAGPSGLEALRAGAIMGRDLMPTTDTSKMDKVQEELKALRAAQPAPGIEALAAYRKAQAEEDALNAEARGTEGSRALRSLFRGFETRDPDAVSSTMAGFTKERRDAIKATENRAQLTSAIVDLQNARAVGDKEKEAVYAKEVIALKQKDNEFKMYGITHGLQSAGSMEQAKITGAASIRAHEITALSHASAQAAHDKTLFKIAELADEAKRAGLSPKEVAAQARYIAATTHDEMLKSIAKRTENLGLSDEDRAKAVKEYIDWQNKLRAGAGLPSLSEPASAAPAAPTDRTAADAILKGKG